MSGGLGPRAAEPPPSGWIVGLPAVLLLCSALAAAPAPSTDEPLRLRRSDGSSATLAELADGRPVALVVIKGAWCAACRDQLVSLSGRLRAVRAAGGRVYGLSHQRPEENAALARRLELPPGLELLSDESHALLAREGAWLDEAGHPLPGLLFLDACGEIAGFLPGRRPGLSQDRLILETLRELADQLGPCGGPEV